MNGNEVVPLIEVKNVRVILPNKAWSKFCKRMEDARRKNQFCDIVFETVEGPVSGHKIVLKLVSKYFEELLSTTNESQKIFIIDGIDGPTLETLISSLYTCRLDISEKTMFDIFVGAKLLNLENALLAAERFINKNRKIENCAEILDFGRFQDCPTLRSPKFVLKNLSEVAKTVGFPLLPIESLQLLISSTDRPKLCSVNDLLSSFHLWVTSNGGSRMDEFLSLVRQLPRQELDEVMMKHVFQEDPLVKEDIACQNFYVEYLLELLQNSRKHANRG